MAQLRWSTTVEVADGPRFAASSSLDAEAYDVVASATVPKRTEVEPATDPKTYTPGTVTVNVQGSDDAADLHLLLLVADRYQGALTFSVEDGGVSDVPLGAPLLLLGRSIGTLLKEAPKRMTFNNDSDQDAKVTVLVARSAS